MSVLGESVRLSAEHLEELRRLSSIDAFWRLTKFEPTCRIDLDRFWKRLAPLMDAVAFPINPITGGSPFPDELRAWTEGCGSWWLSVQEVAVVARCLGRTSYEVLTPHIRAVLEAEDVVYADLDVDSPNYGKLLPPEEASRMRVTDETVAAVEELLVEPYRELVEFFEAAASHGQCTIFWAA
ncbi:hypothetical protein Misp04_34560 [Micromonospora sp. NBRC 101691]|nr:DUF1877 family protein [Micromonospora sp. NBRC 101691]GLY23724.1 hypothetical protein Misp04_34560 [Micromonospora sp. NBRC 101691]